MLDNIDARCAERDQERKAARNAQRQSSAARLTFRIGAEMSEVTYYVAQPFVAADDGIAAGEPTECFKSKRGRDMR
jgi:hypothetical protein